MSTIEVTSPKGAMVRFGYNLCGFPNNCGYRVLYVTDIRTKGAGPRSRWRSSARTPNKDAVRCFMHHLFSTVGDMQRIVMSCSSKQKLSRSTRGIMEALNCYTGEPVRGNHGTSYTTRLGYVDKGIACPEGWSADTTQQW